MSYSDETIPHIQKLLTMLSHSLNVEIAVFDSRCQLVVYTPKYLHHKGRHVHAPALEEVFLQDDIFITNPGHMPSCTGCRFKEQCPSTIELLHSIKINQQTIGAISLTAFNSEGQKRITKKFPIYHAVLRDAAELISIFVKQDHGLNGLTDSITSNLDSSNALQNIKGTSAAINNLKSKIKKIATSKSTVLITGETGTGKELFAKAIHHTSSRSSFPLISINCATIPDNLFESELFGYEEGAFTGAKKGGKPGLIELANRGTLFLDEIGDMPKYTQAKLLRVLQEQTVIRVGGIRSIPLDVRIIAATNQDIADKVLKQDFRADLYYRLNVIPFYIPPLRQRKEDIEVLASFFLSRYNFNLDRQITTFSPETMLLFKSYDWPGNIRELENAVEHAVNMETGLIITPFSLPENFVKPKLITTTEIKDKITTLEVDMIRTTLDNYGWDFNGKTKAAKELGIGIRTLYRKLNILKNEIQEHS